MRTDIRVELRRDNIVRQNKKECKSWVKIKISNFHVSTLVPLLKTPIYRLLCLSLGFPGGSVGKEFACNAEDTGRCEFDPRVGKRPWRRAWQQTPVFFLAWRIPWTEEPGRPQSTGSQKVGHNWGDLARTHAPGKPWKSRRLLKKQWCSPGGKGLHLWPHRDLQSRVISPILQLKTLRIDPAFW